jgi:hypothetical protein
MSDRSIHVVRVVSACSGVVSNYSNSGSRLHVVRRLFASQGKSSWDSVYLTTGKAYLVSASTVSTVSHSLQRASTASTIQSPNTPTHPMLHSPNQRPTMSRPTYFWFMHVFGESLRKWTCMKFHLSAEEKRKRLFPLISIHFTKNVHEPVKWLHSNTHSS